MKDEVTPDDVDVILESLKHYKNRIENYQGYPNYEFRQQQMKRVEAVIAKMRAMQHDLCNP